MRRRTGATMVPKGRMRKRGTGLSSGTIQGMLSLSDPHTLSVISTPHHLKHTLATRCTHDGICSII